MKTPVEFPSEDPKKLDSLEKFTSNFSHSKSSEQSFNMIRCQQNDITESETRRDKYNRHVQKVIHDLLNAKEALGGCSLPEESKLRYDMIFGKTLESITRVYPNNLKGASEKDEKQDSLKEDCAIDLKSNAAQESNYGEPIKEQILHTVDSSDLNSKILDDCNISRLMKTRLPKCFSSDDDLREELTQTSRKNVPIHLLKKIQKQTFSDKVSPKINIRNGLLFEENTVCSLDEKKYFENVIHESTVHHKDCSTTQRIHSLNDHVKNSINNVSRHRVKSLSREVCNKKINLSELFNKEANNDLTISRDNDIQYSPLKKIFNNTIVSRIPNERTEEEDILDNILMKRSGLLSRNQALKNSTEQKFKNSNASVTQMSKNKTDKPFGISPKVHRARNEEVIQHENTINSDNRIKRSGFSSYAAEEWDEFSRKLSPTNIKVPESNTNLCTDLKNFIKELSMYKSGTNSSKKHTCECDESKINFERDPNSLHCKEHEVPCGHCKTMLDNPATLKVRDRKVKADENFPNRKASASLNFAHLAEAEFHVSPIKGEKIFKRMLRRHQLPTNGSSKQELKFEDAGFDLTESKMNSEASECPTYSHISRHRQSRHRHCKNKSENIFEKFSDELSLRRQKQPVARVYIDERSSGKACDFSNKMSLNSEIVESADKPLKREKRRKKIIKSYNETHVDFNPVFIRDDCQLRDEFLSKEGGSKNTKVRDETHPENSHRRKKSDETVNKNASVNLKSRELKPISELENEENENILSKGVDLKHDAVKYSDSHSRILVTSQRNKYTSVEERQKRPENSIESEIHSNTPTPNHQVNSIPLENKLKETGTQSETPAIECKCEFQQKVRTEVGNETETISRETQTEMNKMSPEDSKSTISAFMESRQTPNNMTPIVQETVSDKVRRWEIDPKSVGGPSSIASSVSSKEMLKKFNSGTAMAHTLYGSPPENSTQLEQYTEDLTTKIGKNGRKLWNKDSDANWALQQNGRNIYQGESKCNNFQPDFCNSFQPVCDGMPEVNASAYKSGNQMGNIQVSHIVNEMKDVNAHCPQYELNGNFHILPKYPVFLSYANPVHVLHSNTIGPHISCNVENHLTLGGPSQNLFNNSDVKLSQNHCVQLNNSSNFYQDINDYNKILTMDNLNPIQMKKCSENTMNANSSTSQINNFTTSPTMGITRDQENCSSKTTNMSPYNQINNSTNYKMVQVSNDLGPTDVRSCLRERLGNKSFSPSSYKSPILSAQSQSKDLFKAIRDKFTSGKDMASVLYGGTWDSDRSCINNRV